MHSPSVTMATKRFDTDLVEPTRSIRMRSIRKYLTHKGDPTFDGIPSPVTMPAAQGSFAFDAMWAKLIYHSARPTDKYL